MATIFCASGGSATAPYDTWAKAATSLQTALTAAAAGDVVVIQYNAVPAGDAEVAADTTYTFAAHCSLVSASNDGGSAYTLTAMGTANWIGNSTTNRFIRFAGADLRCLIWGLTLRIAGTTGDSLALATSAGQHLEAYNCYLWQGNTASSGSGSSISLSTVQTAYAKTVDCTFRFGATTQVIDNYGTCEIIGGSIAVAGSIPTTLFSASTDNAQVIVNGMDLSNITGTLVGNHSQPAVYIFDRCSLGSGVTVLATQTSNPTKASASVYVFDCANGDVHGFFGYYDALGQVTTDTTIYKTTNSTGNRSWKIVTSANASYRTPFVTPQIDVNHTGTSAITPYLEILRDGSTTAYTDAEVWAHISAKVTASSTKATFYEDKQALASFLAGTAGTNQAAGAGLAEWTGEAASAWSGKIDSGTSLTPAESGPLTVRVMVAAASATVYVDPEIRGL